MIQNVKVLLVDDEIPATDNMELILKNFCPQVDVLGKAHSVVDALKLIRRTDPDLVFLDVNLKNDTGFDVLELVERISFHVVFASAHEKYAIEAIRQKAFDYILKPIDAQQVVSIVEKVQKLIEVDTPDVVDRLSIHTTDGIEFVQIQNILHVEADGNYASIYLKDGSHIVASKTLKYFEDVLPRDSFFRIHQSHIICLKQVKKYIKTEGGHVELSNGKVLPVSRSKKNSLMELLK